MKPKFAKHYTGKEGYHYLYGRRWRTRRLAHLRQHPLCASCAEHGLVTAATVAHHTTPHKGDRELFMSSPLESLCAQCHDSLYQSIERLGYDKGCDIHGAPNRNKK